MPTVNAEKKIAPASARLSRGGKRAMVQALSIRPCPVRTFPIARLSSQYAGIPLVVLVHRVRGKKVSNLRVDFYGIRWQAHQATKTLGKSGPCTDRACHS